MQAAHARLSPHALSVTSTGVRALVLAGVFLIGAGLLALIDRSAAPAAPRWPTDAQLFTVDGWQEVAPATSEVASSGATFASRTFRSANGMASLSLATSPEAKRIHRAGAAIPFLGNGYSVDPAPPSLVEPAAGRDVLIVRRENELGLLVYAFGERRGLLGNGIPGWAAIAFDAVVGRANDYYLIRVFAPIERLDRSATEPVVRLADELLPRIAGWYAAQP